MECKWQNFMKRDNLKEALISKSLIITMTKKASFLVITKKDYLNINS